MYDVFIGIDNGVTGSIGIVSSEEILYCHMPVKRELDYVKSKRFINRVDILELIRILEKYRDKKVIVSIERPMVNPGRFRATVSALRALEATLIAIEILQFPYRYIDSKEWQSDMLPSGFITWKTSKNGKRVKVKDKVGLKKASLDVARRLFPVINFDNFNDGDGLLIAEWTRRSLGSKK